MIAIDMAFEPADLTRTQVEVQLTLGGIAGDPVFYDASTRLGMFRVHTFTRKRTGPALESAEDFVKPRT